jgi:hypothetical protein
MEILSTSSVMIEIVNPIFCCAGLEMLISQAGRRGCAVLVVWKSGELRFLIQSRGVAYKDEPLAYSVPRGFVINKSSTVNIQYCPFCGRRLSDLVEASVAEFAKLANAHRKFETMADR